MAGIDFPSNPNVNQQHTAFGNVWFWNGESWRKAALNDIIQWVRKSS